MDPEQVRRNLERVREQIGSEVEVLAAVKYVEAADLPALAEAGIELVGENRAQELLAKQEAHGDLFSWDFIGQLQSRKVKDVAPNVRLIHSLASESARDKLEQHPAREVLVQVNVAGEEGKAGIAPGELGDFIARCPVPVGGMMTMPPFAERDEDSRRHFAALAELALHLETAAHALDDLSSDGQAEAGALGVCCPLADLLEGLEDPAQMLGGDARAGVLDAEAHEVKGRTAIASRRPLALHLDPVYVGAHHLARFLAVSFSVAIVARRVVRRLPAQPRQN